MAGTEQDWDCATEREEVESSDIERGVRYYVIRSLTYIHEYMISVISMMCGT